MEPLLTTALTALVSSAVGALVGAIVTALNRKSTKDAEQEAADRAEQQAIKAGVRSLLRSEIMRDHHEGIRRGYTTTVDKEVMQRNFEAYDGLHGNGVVSMLYTEYMALPTKDE